MEVRYPKENYKRSEAVIVQDVVFVGAQTGTGRRPFWIKHPQEDETCQAHGFG